MFSYAPLTYTIEMPYSGRIATERRLPRVFGGLCTEEACLVAKLRQASFFLPPFLYRTQTERSIVGERGMRHMGYKLCVAPLAIVAFLHSFQRFSNTRFSMYRNA